MQGLLRHHRLLARFVLAWFVAALGVAVAAPIAKPQAMQLICSGSGVLALQPVSPDGIDAGSVAMLDCPICITVGAPPVAAPALARWWPKLAGEVPAFAAIRVATTTAAPLPARGPPGGS